MSKQKGNDMKTIEQLVSNDLYFKALDLINRIGFDLDDQKPTLRDIKNVLENGEALDYMGIDDPPLVEEAHALVCEMMEKDYQHLLSGGL